MEILLEDILGLLPPNAQVLCRRPTGRIVGMKKMTGEETADSDFLHIAADVNARSLGELPRGSFLLCSRTAIPMEEIAGPHTNLIVLASLREYVETVEKISDLLSSQSKLDNVARTMMEIIRDGGNIQKLLKYAHAQLENPLMLVDVSFNLIAHVGTGMLKSDNPWKYAIDNKMFSSDYISYVMKRSATSDSKHLVLRNIRVELPDEIASEKQYSIKIFRNNMVVGYIKLLESNRTVTDSDLHIFQILSDYIPFALAAGRDGIRVSSSITEDFLYSLLNGQLTDQYEIHARQELYNLRFYKNLYVISISFIGPQCTATEKDQVSFTLQALRSYFHNGIVILVDGLYVVLYDSTNADIMADEEWANRFGDLLEKLNCTANVSTPFQELHQISNYYRQIQFCVKFRTLSKEHEQLRILQYKDIFEYHMILSLEKEIDLRDLIHPAVKILYEGAASSVDLLNTLFVYTRNRCSIPTTAKIMYLHYNTLKNRINRIESLTGFTGESARDCFMIALSEKILKVLENYSASDSQE